MGLKYFVGGTIWHPRCGPSPNENGTIINGGNMIKNNKSFYLKM